MHLGHHERTESACLKIESGSSAESNCLDLSASLTQALVDLDRVSDDAVHQAAAEERHMDPDGDTGELGNRGGLTRGADSLGVEAMAWFLQMHPIAAAAASRLVR